MIRKLAIDVDNVLADSIGTWCVKASKYLECEIDKNQIASHKIVGSVPMNPKDIFRLQDEVWRDWRNLPTTEPNLTRSISAIRKISVKVIIVTSRPMRLVECVRNWLADNQIDYDELYAIGPKERKASVRADALVDDAPEMIESFIMTGRTGFLYSQPWNRRIKIAGAIMVKNFSDIIRFLRNERALPLSSPKKANLR